MLRLLSLKNSTRCVKPSQRRVFRVSPSPRFAVSPARGATGKRGAEYDIAYVPKAKLEVAVPAAFAERVVETIRDSNIGDGKILVLALESAIADG